MVKLIYKENAALVLEIDKGLKNKFLWSWLDRSVDVSIKIGKNFESITEKLVDFVAKCDVPGKAQCLYCCDLINYGSRGCIALLEHAKGKKHCEKIALRRSNYSLGSAFKCDQQALTSSSLVNSHAKVSEPIVPLSDRIAHSEALVLSVVAENSLPLSMASVILDTARELAKDPKALNHVHLQRTTASYKMRFGVAKTFLEETLEAIRSTPFSLNIDESTSNSDKRVLAILASFYSHKRQMVVVEHLASLEVIRVDTSSLLSELEKFFDDNTIPWANCVSILMDSCNVMRGSKGGLETKLRSGKVPHLLDVDGDSCHHIHNACKKFCGPFERTIEYLQSDLHNDMKWSPGLRQYFEEICLIMGMKFTMPERFLNHRWLSCYDACVKNITMVDAFKVFYISFLGNEDRLLFKEAIIKIISAHNVTSKGTARIKQIWKELAGKRLTDDGKRRKKRIADKLIVHGKETMLVTNFFLSVLPLLKEYVCLFQSKEPLIHLLHDKQEQVFVDFLSCFIKPEFLTGLSAKKLKEFNLESDEGQFLSQRSVFIGKKASDIIEASHKDDKIVSTFKNKASAAYVACAQHMQKRLPLNNSLLRSLSAIDPTARGHSETTKALSNLAEHLGHFLKEEEKERLSLEIHKYQVDHTIRDPVIGERVDHWWRDIIKENKYPGLSQMVVACLSCFHGPMVESSFNTMGDVIDRRSTRMNIKTYSSIQTVRYGLKSQEKSALQMFKKGDVQHETVNSALVKNMRNAAGSYAKERERVRIQKDKKKVLQQKQEVAASRASQKKDMEKATKVARLAHQRAQKRKATQRLEALVLKKKKLCA